MQVILMGLKFVINFMPRWMHTDLSEAVDVYSDWIDACEQANA